MKTTLRNRLPAKREDNDTVHTLPATQLFEALFALYVNNVQQTLLSVTDGSPDSKVQEMVQKLRNRSES